MRHFIGGQIALIPTYPPLPRPAQSVELLRYVHTYSVTPYQLSAPHYESCCASGGCLRVSVRQWKSKEASRASFGFWRPRPRHSSSLAAASYLIRSVRLSWCFHWPVGTLSSTSSHVSRQSDHQAQLFSIQPHPPFHRHKSILVALLPLFIRAGFQFFQRNRSRRLPSSALSFSPRYSSTTFATCRPE